MNSNINHIKYFVLITTSLFCSQLLSQQVGINETNEDPHPSAMLDIRSENKGILIPRLTTAQRTSIETPAEGLMVFDTDLQTMMLFNGSTWINQRTNVGNTVWNRITNGLIHPSASKLGINSSTGTDEIHVQAPGTETSSTIRLESDSQCALSLKNKDQEYQWIFDNNTSVMRLRDVNANADRIRIMPGTDIAFGSSDPTTDFDIQGSLRATGNISSTAIYGNDINANHATFSRMVTVGNGNYTTGQVKILGPNQLPNIEMGSTDAAGKKGKLYINNSAGVPKVKFNFEEWSFAGGTDIIGIVEADMMEAKHIVCTGYPFLEGSAGAIWKQHDEQYNVEMDKYAETGGNISVNGPNGEWRARMFMWYNSNHEYRSFLQASEKNFRMDHPLDPDKEIWYGSLEGPEAGMYMRGTSQLIDGRSMITLPEHFAVMADDENITVLITPLDKSSKGLTVIEKSPSAFTVGELQNGTGNYAFDWEIKAVRKGYKSYVPVRSKDDPFGIKGSSMEIN